MNEFHDDKSFDEALRRQLQDGGDPQDAGFSLRVMAALPPHVAPRQHRGARWVRRSQWVAISLAACGAAALLAGSGGRLDLLAALAAVALLGLLIFWSVPSRWNRG